MKDNIYINDSHYTTYVFNPQNPYYLTIPKELNEDCEMFVSFPIDNPNKTKIKELNDVLLHTNDNTVHLICNLKRSEIDEFSTYNDNKVNLYKNLQKKLYKILASTYDYLKKKEIKVKIPVKLIKQNDADTKLIDWLEIEDQALIKGIDYKKIKKAYNAQIFSGTMAIPFISNPKEVKTKVRKKPSGYTKFYLILTITISLIIGISIAKLLVK